MGSTAGGTDIAGEGLAARPTHADSDTIPTAKGGRPGMGEAWGRAGNPVGGSLVRRVGRAERPGRQVPEEEQEDKEGDRQETTEATEGLLQIRKDKSLLPRHFRHTCK